MTNLSMCNPCACFADHVLDGHDVITDFETGADEIDLDSLLDSLGVESVDRDVASGEITIDNVGEDAVLTVRAAADFSITVVGVDLTENDLNLGSL